MTRKIFIPTMLLAALLCATSYVMAAGKATVAVAAEGPTAAAQINKLAARAPYFLLFDEKGQLAEAVANPHQQAAGGAGPQVVEFLTAKGVKTVIAGEVGPKMTDAMKGKGMTFRTASGSAAEAVKSVVIK